MSYDMSVKQVVELITGALLRRIDEHENTKLELEAAKKEIVKANNIEAREKAIKDAFDKTHAEKCVLEVELVIAKREIEKLKETILGLGAKPGYWEANYLSAKKEKEELQNKVESIRKVCDS